MKHMLENIRAEGITFSNAEIMELNADVAAIKIEGARLSETVQVFSNVEAPPRY
jgi:hypothetical protein